MTEVALQFWMNTTSQTARRLGATDISLRSDTRHISVEENPEYCRMLSFNKPGGQRVRDTPEDKHQSGSMWVTVT